MTIRKEIGIAVIVGLVFGSAVALGIVKANDMLNKNNSQINSETVSAVPTKQFEIQNKLTLDILFPTMQLYTEEAEITVTGKTAPNALVVVTTSGSEALGQSNEQGNFSIPLTLSLGANEVVITSFLQNQKTDKLIVVNYLNPKK